MASEENNKKSVSNKIIHYNTHIVILNSCINKQNLFLVLNKQCVRMADKFTSLKMDWISPGDVHKIFRQFK